MHFSKTFAFIMLAIILSPAAHAQNELQLIPENLWYDTAQGAWEETSAFIQIKAWCNSTAPSIVAQLKRNINIKDITLAQSGTPGLFESTLATDFLDFLYAEQNSGEYIVTSACQNDTISDSFRIHNIYGSVEKINGFSAEGHEPAYLGASYDSYNSNIKAYVRIYDSVGYQQNSIATGNLSFPNAVFRGDKNITFTGISFMESVACEKCIVLLLEGIDTKGFTKDKHYFLEVNARYLTGTGEKSILLKSERPIVIGDSPGVQAPVKSITMTAPESVFISGETEKAIELTIVPDNIDNFTILKTDFSASIYKGNKKVRELNVNSLVCRESKCTLSLGGIPDLEDNTDYTLDIVLKYGSITKKTSIDVVEALSFSGVMKDTSGVLVPATLEFSGPSYEVISTGNDGSYSASLVPGTYDITLTYSKFSSTVPLVVLIKSAKITKQNLEMAPNPITYSHYTKDVNLDGMSVADLLVIQFAIPFESAVIKMPYDESRIYDDSAIQILQCSNWNSGRRNCVGDWSAINDTVINTYNNFVTFTSDMLSAFVVSGKESLNMHVDAVPETFFAEEQIRITGRVLDNDGNPVKDADASYEIKDTNIAGAVKTTISGAFEMLFSAPVKSGDYEIVFFSKKNPYHSSDNQSAYIAVEQRKELSFIMPESSVIVLDNEKKSKITFKVKNTGQTELTNIDIGVQTQGLPTEMYRLSLSKIDKLAAGAEHNVSLTIPLTSQFCASMGCRTIYSFAVSGMADGLKARKEAALVAEVVINESTAETNITSNELGGQSAFAMDFSHLSDSFKSITGQMSTTRSSNSYIVLATIVIGFIITFIKRRNSKGGRVSGSAFDHIKNKI